MLLFVHDLGANKSRYVTQKVRNLTIVSVACSLRNFRLHRDIAKLANVNIILVHEQINLNNICG